MIENPISGNLYNEIFSESIEEKCTVFLSMAWSLTVHKNTVENCSTFLQEFFTRSLSLCILYFLFHKDKATSAIPLPSVHHFVFVFPHFFSFS